MRLIALASLSAGLVACGQGAGATNEAPAGAAARSTTDLTQQRRATLDRIAAQCGMPAETFIVIDAETIHFRPSPDSDFEKVECALQKFGESDIPQNTLGFVGNEAFRTETTNAPSH